MLRFEGVRARYGATWALVDVSFELEPGSLTALTGPNGSGKSTLLRVAATLERPVAGRVRLAGAEVADDPVAARARIGWLGQSDGLYDELTVRENLALVARLHGSAARLEDAARAFAIDARLETRARALSRGERQRAALARATLGGRLLLLDEPTTTLDADAADVAASALLALRGERTLLVATHDPALVKRCDRRLRLERGRLVEGAA